MDPLITDAELLDLCLAEKAINGIDITERAASIQAASDMMRSKCRPHYSVFEDATYKAGGAIEPAHDVKMHVASIATYNLLGRRGFNPAKGASSQIEKRYENTLKEIEAIRLGHTDLTGLTRNRGAPLVGGTGTSSWENWRGRS